MCSYGFEKPSFLQQQSLFHMVNLPEANANLNPNLNPKPNPNPNPREAW